MVALDEVWAKFEELAQPQEPIEVSLSEAVGLVLAEAVIADVDLPPFDRAGAEGFAVRTAEAVPGALLRVIAPPTAEESEYDLEAGESAHVAVGGPLPVGADSVLTPEQVRIEGGPEGPGVIEVLEAATDGRLVVARGTLLRSGTTLLEAGTRLTPAMAGLLASQGCVHPLCHRRVRVALLAIGDHLVGPLEAPILHRERNAANLAITPLLVASGAMVHDLGCVSEAEAGPALDRATTAQVVIVLGDFNGGTLRRLAHDGVEPIFTGLDYSPGGSIQYGVIRDEQGYAVSHLLHLPLDPTEAVINTAILALPLIARLQGGGSREATGRCKAHWEGSAWGVWSAVPALLRCDASGRLIAGEIVERGRGDLPELAKANAIALVPPGDEGRSTLVVDVVPIGPVSTV